MDVFPQESEIIMAAISIVLHIIKISSQCVTATVGNSGVDKGWNDTVDMQQPGNYDSICTSIYGSRNCISNGADNVAPPLNNSRHLGANAHQHLEKSSQNEQKIHVASIRRKLQKCTLF